MEEGARGRRKAGTGEKRMGRQREENTERKGCTWVNLPRVCQEEPCGDLDRRDYSAVELFLPASPTDTIIKCPQTVIEDARGGYLGANSPASTVVIIISAPMAADRTSIDPSATRSASRDTPLFCRIVGRPGVGGAGRRRNICRSGRYGRPWCCSLGPPRGN